MRYRVLVNRSTDGYMYVDADTEAELGSVLDQDIDEDDVVWDNSSDVQVWSIAEDPE